MLIHHNKKPGFWISARVFDAIPIIGVEAFAVYCYMVKTKKETLPNPFGFDQATVDRCLLSLAQIGAIELEQRVIDGKSSPIVTLIEGGV